MIPETHVDDMECVVCARKIAGLLVRISTGVCTRCEDVTPGGCGQ